MSAALADRGRNYQTGDVVVVRRSNSAGTYEHTIRQFEEDRDGIRLIAKPAAGEIPAIIPAGNIEILGIALKAVRVFGRAN